MCSLDVLLYPFYFSLLSVPISILMPLDGTMRDSNFCDMAPEKTALNGELLLRPE